MEKKTITEGNIKNTNLMSWLGTPITIHGNFGEVYSCYINLQFVLIRYNSVPQKREAPFKYFSSSGSACLIKTPYLDMKGKYCC